MNNRINTGLRLNVNQFISAVNLIVLFMMSCTRVVYDVAYPTLSDGKYDTEFPYKDCSRQLEEISKTIKKVRCTAYYRSYLFAENQNIQDADLLKIDLDATANGLVHYNESSHGTATIIYASASKLALLTCAHIVDFPDTVISHHFTGTEDGVRVVQSLAIRVQQHYWISEMPLEGEVQLLVKDTGKDLAILGKELTTAVDLPLTVFDYPFGQARRLEWGSFVYIMGYPIGYKMITQGIVSDPNRDSMGSFLIDALFNRGFSGGIVLAIKDGVPNFELVGIAKSVSANQDYFLVPAPEMNESTYDPYFPYTGDRYVQKITDINYGITYAISAETIKNFVKRNEHILKKAGYNLDKLWTNH